MLCIHETYLVYFIHTYNYGNKLSGQLRKTAMSLTLTPQAMYNQFKRPSAGIVRELYYIYKDLRSNESRDHYHEGGYLVPSPRYGFRFEAVSRHCRNSNQQFPKLAYYITSYQSRPRALCLTKILNEDISRTKRAFSKI